MTDSLSTSLRSVPTAQDDAMTTLVQRLEAAEVGSRELDCRIEVAVGLAVALDGAGRATAGDGTRYRVPHYSTSLDAALALAERVVGEDHALTLLQDVLADHDASGASIRTIPMRLCAKTLRAKDSSQ